MQLPLLLPLFSFLIPIAVATPLDPRTTCSLTNTISDGGFESGTNPSAQTPNPWKVDLFFGSTTYSLTSPGSSLSGGGRYAFTASVYPGPYTPTSGETLSQVLKTCPGQNYSIWYDFKFNATVENACSLRVEYPYKDTVGSVTWGSATPGLVPGVWTRDVVLFQAVTKSDVLKVIFRCTNGAKNLISVDNFVAKPYTGNVY
ncbi:MAG: hypothetical protein Q9223_004503 [Gallowayella weberi]